jgi:flagellar hook-associated protein 2
MSTSSLGINSVTGAPITITGLASGLETSKIIAALMGAEREPVTHLTDESQKLQAEQTELQSIQSSLRQLASAISEFSLPSLFEESQAVTSNEPARVSATVTSGAGVGGYEVEVTQLANAAQRTFTFTSPKAEQTLTIEGHEFKLEAGESAKELASAIDTSSGSPVYAAVLEGETLVLSSRATGNTGTEFIKVTGAVNGERRQGRRIQGRRRGRKIEHQHGHQRDRRRHADTRRSHHHRPRHDRCPGARAQREQGRSAGAVVRQALQLDR